MNSADHTRGARRHPPALLLASLIAAPVHATCIPTTSIERTKIANDRTVVFYMNDGAIYENRLPHACPGLASAPNGFTYTPTVPGSAELCDNLGTFEVNGVPPGVPGPVCLWGAFHKRPSLTASH